MASPTTLTVPNGSTDPTNPQPPSITTHLISPTALATSPYMPALFALINRTYNHAHNSYGRSLLPPVECSRLSTHEQLGEEIGEGGFTFTMLSAPNQQEDSKSEKGVIGTASAKPYTPPKPDDAKKGSISEATKLFKRQPGTEKELEEHARLPNGRS